MRVVERDGRGRRDRLQCWPDIDCARRREGDIWKGSEGGRKNRKGTLGGSEGVREGEGGRNGEQVEREIRHGYKNGGK